LDPRQRRFYLSDGISNAGWFMNKISNLNISGGWNSNFTVQTVYSILNGGGTADHVVWMQFCRDVVFTNFVITGGNTTVNGAGIYVSYSTNAAIHCVVSNNNSGNMGGGAFVYQCSNLLIGGAFANNRAASGGGINVYYCQFVDVTADIFQNQTTSSGGGVYAGSCQYLDFSGEIANNTSCDNGAGVYASSLYCCQFTGNVYGNTTTSQGGGFFFYYCSLNTVDCSVYNNVAARGGAVGSTYTYGNQYNGLYFLPVANTYDGGAFYRYGGMFNTIDATVSNNASVNNGGGISISGSDSMTIQGLVMKNRATNCGGGLYIDSTSNTILCSINNNSAGFARA
jgi:hypothetical protein